MITSYRLLVNSRHHMWVGEEWSYRQGERWLYLAAVCGMQELQREGLTLSHTSQQPRSYCIWHLKGHMHGDTAALSAVGVATC